MASGRHSGILRIFAIVLTLWAVGPLAYAASPVLNDIVPRGAQRGTEAEILFVGARLDDAVDLLFHDPGISVVSLTAESGSQVKCKLKIAPDAPIQTHAIRVRTASGLSNLQLFSVGNLPEITETEPNNAADAAQAVSINTTVNGVVTNEDVDYFAVELVAEERLAVEVEAIRLGGPLFDAKVRLYGPGGHELIAEDDTPLFRQDPGFVFTSHEAGRHLVVVSEASYGGGGNYRYRLHVGNFPRPLGVTPMGGVVGTETQVTWLGDPALDTANVPMPPDKEGRHLVVPAVDAAVAPTPVPFRLSKYPGVLETEPNNARAEATAGSVPGAFDGVIQAPDDRDWFTFEGKKGQKLEFRLWAREMGSPLDSVMAIYKAGGDRVDSNDDSQGMDSYMKVTLPEDGAYEVLVRDHLSSGGPLYAYRIEATPIEPSLRLSLLENEPVHVAVPKGNRAYLLVRAARSEFGGDLTLNFDGLPEGVTAEAAAIPSNQDRVPVVLHATAETPTSGALVDITSAFQTEGGEIFGRIDQDYVLTYGQNKTVFQTRNVDRVALAVTEPAPYSVEIVPPKAPVVQRGIKHLRVIAHRNEGFDAPIRLRVPYAPPNVGAATAEIPKDQTETTVRIEAQPNAAPGTWNAMVLADSAGYSVCTPFTPVDIVAPWVEFSTPAIAIEQGQTKEFVVAVTQKQPFEGEYQAHLVALPKGVSAPPQPLTKETTELRFPITVAADAPVGKHGSLVVDTTLKTNDEDVFHRGGGNELQIFAPLPPELQQPDPPKPAEAKAEEAKPEEPERKTRFPNT